MSMEWLSYVIAIVIGLSSESIFLCQKIKLIIPATNIIPSPKIILNIFI